MDFTFTEEQQAAVEAAKAVFSGVAPDGVPSPALTPGAVAEEFDRPLWARLAGVDLLSLVLSPEYGGAGLDPIALCLVLRESAKVLARVPLLETSAVAMAVERYGSAELSEEILPGSAAASWSSLSGPMAAPVTTPPSSPSPPAGTPTAGTAGCSTACSQAFPGPSPRTALPYRRTPMTAMPLSL